MDPNITMRKYLINFDWLLCFINSTQNNNLNYWNILVVNFEYCKCIFIYIDNITLIKEDFEGVGLK